MNVKKIKEFVKEHKGEIAMGCLVAVAGVAGVTLYRSVRGTTDLRVETYAKSEEAKQALEGMYVALNAWDQMSEGANSYIGWKADDGVDMFDNNIFINPDGDNLKVTGAILFGNEVEA